MAAKSPIGTNKAGKCPDFWIKASSIVATNMAEKKNK